MRKSLLILACAVLVPLVAQGQTTSLVNSGMAIQAGQNAAALNAEGGGLSTAQMLESVRRLVGQSAAQAAATVPGVRTEVEVGAINPQLKLAPCTVVEPFLPPGTRAWGQTRVGLRCVQGPVRWSVYVPVVVRAFGQALAAQSALPAGHLLQSEDLALQEVDMAAESGPVSTDPAAWVGRTLTTALRAGQGLRPQHVRARQWFAAGETVQLVARGPGFSIASDGQALTPGIEGQTVRIKTESGRIVMGMPVGQRRVEVNL